LALSRQTGHKTSVKLDARQVLNEAMAAAKADDKALFVDFSADS
jgi:hypothetical protein